VGGLVVAAAFVLYAISSGSPASRRALLLDSSHFLSVGLLIALASGVIAILQGRPFMTAAWMSLGSQPGGVLVGTPLLFDVGVFLAVIGVVLTIVFTLSDVVLNED
jgi:multisubunit Na+/H+ antiporter MnhB subunit